MAKPSFRTEPEVASAAEGPTTLAEWTSSAPVTAATKKKQKAPARPWEGLDKDAPQDVSFSLRINEYERCLLECVAKENGRSMQKEARRRLVMGLERAVRGAKAEPEQAHYGPEPDL